MNPDTLIFEGGEVKSLGDGKVAGWLCRFGAPDQTDLTKFRDYFTKDTDFGAHTTTPLYYYHGQDPDVGRVEIGQGTIAVKQIGQDVGVWLEGQLAARKGYEQYVQAIGQMAKDGKLGFSSGTAPHLMERQAQKNGANWISKWPLGLDATLTPIPADPRATAFAVKSLADLPPISFDGLKGLHLGKHAEKGAALSAMESLNYSHRGRVMDHLNDDELDDDAKHAAIGGCFDEYKDLSMKAIKALTAAPGDDPTAAIKAIRDTAVGRLVTGLTIAENSDAVVAAVKGLTVRYQKRAASRAAEGRSLTDAQRAALKSFRDELDELLGTKATTADPGGAQKSAAGLLAEFLQIESDVLCTAPGASST